MPVDPSFHIEAQALAQILDDLDYFQVLKIPNTASPSEIKAAYYRESRLYHPDQFFTEEAELRGWVVRIYKRITEAYVVLRDDAKRAKYIQDISGAERSKKLRFTEATEQEQKKEREAEFGTTPNGRKFFMAAMADLQRGNQEAAARNLKMALMYEPNNASFKARMDEIVAAQKAAAAAARAAQKAK